MGDLLKRKIGDKNLFLDNFESSSEKLWKMISANVKADVNEMKYPIFFCKI